MSNTDDAGKGARALLEARNRLDQGALLASYIATDLLSRIQTFVLGAVVAGAVIHGCSVEYRLDGYEAAATARESRLAGRVEEVLGRVSAAEYNVGQIKGKLDMDTD